MLFLSIDTAMSGFEQSGVQEMQLLLQTIPIGSPKGPIGRLQLQHILQFLKDRVEYPAHGKNINFLQQRINAIMAPPAVKTMARPVPVRPKVPSTYLTKWEMNNLLLKDLIAKIGPLTLGGYVTGIHCATLCEELATEKFGCCASLCRWFERMSMAFVTIRNERVSGEETLQLVQSRNDELQQIFQPAATQKVETPLSPQQIQLVMPETCGEDDSSPSKRPRLDG